MPSPPASVTRSAVSSIVSGRSISERCSRVVRPVQYTVAPASPSATAMPRPAPRVAPATSATRPSNVPATRGRLRCAPWTPRPTAPTAASGGRGRGSAPGGAGGGGRAGGGGGGGGGGDPHQPPGGGAGGSPPPRRLGGG